MFYVFEFKVELDPSTEETQEEWESGDIIYF